ncbi:hypothetical protein CEXT_489991 [Caerostris extrusa]|uniref:Uncharacterized protein n=1 Tax=Caerostris extrusa TaxID=172846 RepID=A0AAV4XZP8_CAEEX|nr:hypothetical protein CEXT_489991 [Caerostris extrusa]
MRQKRSTPTPPRSQRNWGVVHKWTPDEASAEMLDGIEFGFEKAALTRPLYRPRKCIPRIPVTGILINAHYFSGTPSQGIPIINAADEYLPPEFGNSSMLLRVQSTPIRVAIEHERTY